MDLIDAIHAGDVKKAKSLAAVPTLINAEDAQKNTPLHYAVAQHALELIPWLIERGAKIDCKNHLQETAADWFQLLVISLRFAKLSDLKILRQQIECNNSQFVVDILASGLSRELRFPQANTILHWAVDYQREAIIEVILKGCDCKVVDRLLHLSNSQGVTPLMLAQRHCQLGSSVSQKIMSYLQAKQQAMAVEVGSAWALPALWRLVFSYQPSHVEEREIWALKNAFNNRCGPLDIMQLNPLRSTMVKLAYNLCHQAHHHCQALTPAMVSRSSGRPAFKMKKFFERLFGKWTDSDQKIFKEKLFAVLQHLYGFIENKLADQIIEFSAELSHSGGCIIPNVNKIFLKPRMDAGALAVLATLIHEITHRAAGSYDFFSTKYANDIEGFFVSLGPAFQLVAKGTAGELTAEKRRLFEARQLLETGFHPGWKQDLHHWMALNSAETLTVAIMALATIPMGFAQYDSQPKPALVIKPQFLQMLCGVATPLKPPVPETPLVFGPCGKKRYKVSSSELSADRPARLGTADSGDSGISSAGSSTVMEMDWSETNEQASSPSHLIEAAGTWTPEQTLASPLALSPEAHQARAAPSLPLPDGQKLSGNCITS